MWLSPGDKPHPELSDDPAIRFKSLPVSVFLRYTLATGTPVFRPSPTSGDVPPHAPTLCRSDDENRTATQGDADTGSGRRPG